MSATNKTTSNDSNISSLYQAWDRSIALTERLLHNFITNGSLIQRHLAESKISTRTNPSNSITEQLLRHKKQISAGKSDLTSKATVSKKSNDTSKSEKNKKYRNRNRRQKKQHRTNTEKDNCSQRGIHKRTIGKSLITIRSKTKKVTNNIITDPKLQIAIVAEDGSSVTDADGAYIRRHIWQEIQNLLDDDQSTVVPKVFRSGLVRYGWFLILCSDVISVDWLLSLKVIRKENRCFKVMRVIDLPRKYKATTYIKHFKKPGKEVLKYLKKQNPSLRTEQWRITNEQEVDDGVFLVFKIDEFSAKNLSKMDFRPFFIGSKIRIKVHDIQIATIDAPTGSSAATNPPPGAVEPPTTIDPSVQANKEKGYPVGKPASKSRVLNPRRNPSRDGINYYNLILS